MSMAKFTEFLSEQQMRYGAGVCVFCPKTGRFLLQKRGPRVDDPGEHDWFGGGVDEGEDILTAAVRELEEEGGIKAKPESLYPLARFGYQPEKGLGGYHIWLLLVDDEYEPELNYDADSHDEVAGANWIGPNEWKSITPHERVRTLFADPQFVETLKHATQKMVEGGHIGKLIEEWIYEKPTIEFMVLRESQELYEFNMQQFGAAVQQKMQKAGQLISQAQGAVTDNINAVFIKTANATQDHPATARIIQMVKQNPRLALFGSAILSMVAAGAFEGITPNDVIGTIDHVMQTGQFDEAGIEMFNELVQAQTDPTKQDVARRAGYAAAAAGAT